MKALRVPFAIHRETERIVDVHGVLGGKACNCVCPACRAQLVARKNHQTPHFAHLAHTECPAGLETAIHKAAKQVLLEAKCLWLPDYNFSIRDPRLYVTYEGLAFQHKTITHFDEVVDEVSLGEVIPDILCTKAGRQLAVEIEVTHPVDDEKAACYRRRNLSAIRIDLSDRPETLSLSELRSIMQRQDAPQKHWIHNSREEAIDAAAREGAVRRDTIKRKSHHKTFPVPHVDNCPQGMRQHGSSYFANVVLDCKRCEYVTYWSRKFVWCAEGEVIRQGNAVKAMPSVDNPTAKPRTVFDPNQMNLL